MTDVSSPPGAVRRVAFPPSWPTRMACIALALYVVYACSILDIGRERLVAGFGHGARFVSRMFPPNFAHDKLELLYGGMIESLQIAIIATTVGVLLSLPLGLSAARNLSPLPLAWLHARSSSSSARFTL
jgi:ABC-type phosphate/phosphonate transport system permease subunit